MNVPFRLVRYVILCCVLLHWIACRQNIPVDAVLHTSMGDIQVQLSGMHTPYHERFLDISDSQPVDTLSFDRIERDFAIRFGPAPGDQEQEQLSGDATGTPVTTGALAYAMTEGSHGEFFVVLGRAQTKATLDATEQKTAVRLSEKDRELYLKQGGLPQLQGRCAVFGKVTAGMEVAQKIAALPRDAQERPLQPVYLWIEIVR